MENKAIKPVADTAIICGNKTLLVKYIDANKYDHQKGWFVPDDLMQHAEHPEDAASRILKEQLGIEGFEPKLGFIESFVGGDKSWHLIFHYYIRVEEGINIGKSGQVSEAEWFDVNALPDKKDIAHHGWAEYIISEITKSLK